MRIVLHQDIPDDPLLQQQWNALVQQVERPEVFYTHQWALAVRRGFGESLLPMLVLAYKGEKLSGVAALALDPFQKTASFLSGTSADYCDLLSHPDDRAELLEAVLAELRRAGWQSVALTSLPAESATISALRSAQRKRGYYLFLRPTATCAQVDLGFPEERAQLKSAVEKKKIFRHSLNVLAREGPVSFRHLVTWDAIEPVLASFSVAHVARFLAMGRSSNIVSIQRRVFLSELARLLSESGWVVLSQMLVSDRPIAWNYGFQFHGSWFWYQPTFETSYERLSPGYCLLSKIITEACDKTDMRVVDLGLGAEGYKERFANGSRFTLHATLTKSLGRHMREIVRYHAVQAVKSAPKVESAVRAVLAFAARTGREFKKIGVWGFAHLAAKRVASLINSREEVAFYRWTGDHAAQEHEVSLDGLRLQPIELETLAVAAMCYENEEDTLNYLLHSARRLHPKTGQGFALCDRDGKPVHFCWISDFEGLEMKEWTTRLSAPSPTATMIFDCWTPQSKRGRGYHGIALLLVARHISKSSKEPWTFSAIPPHSSRKGIERAGFERKYSMTCKKTLVWRRLSKVVFEGSASTREAQASS